MFTFHEQENMFTMRLLLLTMDLTPIPIPVNTATMISVSRTLSGPYLSNKPIVISYASWNLFSHQENGRVGKSIPSSRAAELVLHVPPVIIS
jgi:hypothetical protein